jgi:hypothetical protein
MGALKNHTWVLTLLLLGTMGFPQKFISGNAGQPQSKILIHSLETDSIRYDLWLLSGENGLPEQYHAEIFTPVCYSDKCYPVFIDFYWDLLGNFKNYQMPPGKTLTKNDHEEFKPEEYQKMQEILANASSMLGEYKAEELVVEQREEMAHGVDAVTGATLKTLQNEVISGAVYSCYTLWHIAHGEITQLTRQHTANIKDPGMIIRFLKSNNHHYQYWAIDEVLEAGEQPDEQFSSPLLEILRGDNIFISRYLLEKLPIAVLQSEERQDWLWETYLTSPYRLQMALLDKMEKMDLHPGIHQSITSQLAKSNPAQQGQLLDVLISQDKLSREVQDQLLTYLEDDKWGSVVYQILDRQEPQNKKIKQALKQQEK